VCGGTRLSSLWFCERTQIRFERVVALSRFVLAAFGVVVVAPPKKSE
jgi:hypothetical protein